jgi:hypothetical protein
MKERRFPKYRVLQQSEDGTFQQAVDAEGVERWRQGESPHLVQRDAIRDALQLAEQNPEVVFVVVDPQGAEVYRVDPVPVAPF